MADYKTGTTPAGSFPISPPGGCSFTSTNCGSITGTAEGGGCMPGEVSINGSTDLSSCIVGNDGANVATIKVGFSNEPVYKFIIWVYGQGPAGIGSGNLDLRFTDATGDTYALSLHSSTLEWHYVAYNSANPGIVSIQWSP